jgi:hypothetical protein
VTQSTASIDDLLRYEEERPPGPRRGQSTAVWVAKTVLYATGISGLIVLLARLVGLGLPYAVVFAAVLALLLLRRVLHDVAPVPPAAPAALAERDDDWQLSWPTPDGLFTAAGRWDTRLSWTHTDPERFTRLVIPAIAEVADERLRQKHGITMATDPVRARGLLGDPLWTFLTTPLTRPPTPQQISAVVAHLEAL